MEKQIYMKDEAFCSQWEGARDGILPAFPAIEWTRCSSLMAELYLSWAGRIPVLYMKEREEFEYLIRQLFFRGEERPIPPSLGALTIRGLKDKSGISHRIILLSSGYYSGVSPKEMGLSEALWMEKSHIIRLQHECAHYYMLRACGELNSGLKQELIADAMGIITAFGVYRAEYFLRFLGLERYPVYREGGRLQNYVSRKLREPERGQAMRDMADKAWRAAYNLEEFLRKNSQYTRGDTGRRQLLNILISIEEDRLTQSGGFH